MKVRHKQFKDKIFEVVDEDEDTYYAYAIIDRYRLYKNLCEIVDEAEELYE